MNTFTVPELVPILHLKQRAIRKLIADGQLRGRLVGRQYLTTEAALKVSVAVRKGVRLAAQVGPGVRLPSELDAFEERLAVNNPQEEAFSPLRLRLAR